MPRTRTAAQRMRKNNFNNRRFAAARAAMDNKREGEHQILK